MAYYNLAKTARAALYKEMEKSLEEGLTSGNLGPLFTFSSDPDTYLRKNSYLAMGRLALKSDSNLKSVLLQLDALFEKGNELHRQTAINAFGEIGKKNFACIEKYMGLGLLDPNHRVRNAVIGSLKKMGETNPEPVLKFCQPNLSHPDFEVRREICHGLELRGRTQPEDILPLLQQLQWDEKARVRNTLVHVLGQIAYKKGCLEKVCAHLQKWQNKDIVAAAIAEIIDVHRYRNFSFYNQDEAKNIIHTYFNLQS